MASPNRLARVRKMKMSKKQKFAKVQPKNGDCVLSCGHDVDGECHFFICPTPCTFQRPDKTWGKANFIMVCNECFLRFGERAPIRTDYTWVGDDPVIEEPTEMNAQIARGLSSRHSTTKAA
jgi:hypothetical protein